MKNSILIPFWALRIAAIAASDDAGRKNIYGVRAVDDGTRAYVEATDARVAIRHEIPSSGVPGDVVIPVNLIKAIPKKVEMVDVGYEPLPTDATTNRVRVSWPDGSSEGQAPNAGSTVLNFYFNDKAWGRAEIGTPHLGWSTEVLTTVCALGDAIKKNLSKSDRGSLKFSHGGVTDVVHVTHTTEPRARIVAMPCLLPEDKKS